jgi:hypothetical protein
VINLAAAGTTCLKGTPSNSTYKGMLFFEDPNTTVYHKHTLSGGSALQLTGTIHLTNTLATMQSTPTVYQELDLTGGSGSNTTLAGEIIAGKLVVSGGGTVTIDLTAIDTSNRKVTLVK